jgi:hypothetical protein
VRRLFLIPTSYDFVVEVLLGLHDLVYEAQCCAQRQPHHIVVGALYALDENGACGLNAVAARFVVAVACAHVGKDEFVGDCMRLAMQCDATRSRLMAWPTIGIKLDLCLLDMRLHPVPGHHGALERAHDGNGRHDLVLLLVPQHLQHANVIGLSPRLLQYPARVADDDGVGGDDDGRLAQLRVVDLAAVDFGGLCARRLEHIVQRAEVVGEVFGELRGADIDVAEAELGQQLSPPRRRRGKHNPLPPQQIQRGDAEWPRGPRWWCRSSRPWHALRRLVVRAGHSLRVIVGWWGLRRRETLRHGGQCECKTTNNEQRTTYNERQWVRCTKACGCAGAGTVYATCIPRVGWGRPYPSLAYRL